MIGKIVLMSFFAFAYALFPTRSSAQDCVQVCNNGVCHCDLPSEGVAIRPNPADAIVPPPQQPAAYCYWQDGACYGPPACPPGADPDCR